MKFTALLMVTLGLTSAAFAAPVATPIKSDVTIVNKSGGAMFIYPCKAPGAAFDISAKKTKTFPWSSKCGKMYIVDDSGEKIHFTHPAYTQEVEQHCIVTIKNAHETDYKYKAEAACQIEKTDKGK